uniref:Uncharacterized protein n=1 Tax=Romanomermis culicivorax TaxID=13658 RepID=A0A915HV90_ROMCU
MTTTAAACVATVSKAGCFTLTTCAGAWGCTLTCPDPPACAVWGVEGRFKGTLEINSPAGTKKLIKRLGAVGLARQLSPLPPSAQRPIRRTTKPSSADSRSTLSLPPPSLSPPPPRESAKPPTPLKTPTVTLKPLSNRSTKKPLLIGCGCLAIILVGGVVLALIYLSKLREIEPHTMESITIEKEDNKPYLIKNTSRKVTFRPKDQKKFDEKTNITRNHRNSVNCIRCILKFFYGKCCLASLINDCLRFNLEDVIKLEKLEPASLCYKVIPLGHSSSFLNFTKVCQEELKSRCSYYPDKYVRDCTYQIECRHWHVYAQRVIVLRPEMWSHRLKFRFSHDSQTIDIPYSLRKTTVIPCQSESIKAGYCLDSTCSPFKHREWKSYESLQPIKGGLGDDQSYGKMDKDFMPENIDKTYMQKYLHNYHKLTVHLYFFCRKSVASDCNNQNRKNPYLLCAQERS